MYVNKSDVLLFIAIVWENRLNVEWNLLYPLNKNISLNLNDALN
jgi:hypothetical protein